MSRSGLTAAPFYIDQEEPAPAGGLPKPGKLEVHLPDNHLQYAITWFGLALALAGVMPDRRRSIRLTTCLNKGISSLPALPFFVAHWLTHQCFGPRQTSFLEVTYFAHFAKHGVIGFLDEKLAIFRYHDRGVYGCATRTEHLRQAIDAHRLVGWHLDLEARPSYARGLARMENELAELYFP